MNVGRLGPPSIPGREQHTLPRDFRNEPAVNALAFGSARFADKLVNQAHTLTPSGLISTLAVFAKFGNYGCLFEPLLECFVATLVSFSLGVCSRRSSRRNGEALTYLYKQLIGSSGKLNSIHVQL